MIELHPYWHEGEWVFDDPAHGLDKEPFVGAASQIVTGLVAGLENARAGFKLLVSDVAFDGYAMRFFWVRADEALGGNWYKTNYGLEAWLCPALLCYFPTAPERIYVRAEPLDTNR